MDSRISDSMINNGIAFYVPTDACTDYGFSYGLRINIQTRFMRRYQMCLMRIMRRYRINIQTRIMRGYMMCLSSINADHMWIFDKHTHRGHARIPDVLNADHA